ncbi:hypothetical protein MF672_018335 [Actinomadura sp. ATCC 31491]|uniref:Uncharacterized protein n=1 Tax=Actinomadura luzonensis TaxID=2805427 RepID=A0ABT0FTS0_9ACTN|nr:hypothetical protein [Actinomadura luzonensis]MCK2215735.1 hypothetical protein [Actinomadura luzonensis]
MALAIPIMALIGLMLMQVLEETLLPSSPAPASGPRTLASVTPEASTPEASTPEPVVPEPVVPEAGSASLPHAQRRRPSHRTRRSPSPRPRHAGRRTLRHVLPQRVLPQHGRHESDAAQAPVATESPAPVAVAVESQG